MAPADCPTAPYASTPGLPSVHATHQGAPLPPGSLIAIKGDPGSISADAGNLLTNGSDGGALLLDATVRSIAADQDTAQVYDFDALVSATLGV